MWTADEKEFLRNNWENFNNDELGLKLGKSIRAISAKGCRLGLKRKKPGGIPFSKKPKPKKPKKPLKNDYGYRLGNSMPKLHDSVSAEDYHTYVKAVENAYALKVFRENFNLQGIQKLAIKSLNERGLGSNTKRIVSGKVISSNGNIITMQLKNYKESFMLISFFCREIQVLKYK